MSHNYQAIIENGQIKWLDTPSPETTGKVIVTVLAPVEKHIPVTANQRVKKHQLGFMQGEMTVPDGIN